MTHDWFIGYPAHHSLHSAALAPLDQRVVCDFQGAKTRLLMDIVHVSFKEEFHMDCPQQ